MTKNRWLYAAALICGLLVFTMSSCSNSEEQGDNANPAINFSYLRFVSSCGTNVLDSLKVFEKDGPTSQEIKDSLISIKCIRTSDNQQLDMINHLFYANSQADYEFPRDETLIRLNWVDFNTWDLEKRPYHYDEVYDILLQSSKIFGDNETHHLKWYVSVVGRAHNALKCEVDGQKVSLDDDPLYNREAIYGVFEVNGIITIPCK
jgi:hypothetical protein